MTANTNERRWATIDEAAAYLGVATKTIRRMITDGQVTGYRLGARLIRVDLDELDTQLRPMQSIRSTTRGAA